MAVLTIILFYALGFIAGRFTSLSGNDFGRREVENEN
jgi:hypothetical protein